MKKTGVLCFTVWILVAAIISLFANSSEIYAQQCEAEFVRALKTEYKEVSSDKIGKALYEASCKAKTAGTTTGLDISSPRYGNLAYNDSESSASIACATRDESFFSDSARDLTISALPSTATNLLSNCFGGLTLRVAKDGNTLSILVAYKPTDGKGTGAILNNLTILPKSAVQCGANEVLKSGQPLGPGGYTLGCTIANEDQDITIILNTDQGTKKAVVKREPKIKTVAYEWKVERVGSELAYWCKTDNKVIGVKNEIHPTLRTESVHFNERLLAGSCLEMHGKGEVIIDGGDPIILKDSWGIEKLGEGQFRGQFNCTLNGAPMGKVPLRCQDLNTCKRDLSMAIQCAAQYGLEYRKSGHDYKLLFPNLVLNEIY